MALQGPQSLEEQSSSSRSIFQEVDKVSAAMYGSCEESLLTSVWERKNLASVKLVGPCALESHELTGT